MWSPLEPVDLAMLLSWPLIGLGIVLLGWFPNPRLCDGFLYDYGFYGKLPT